MWVHGRGARRRRARANRYFADEPEHGRRPMRHPLVILVNMSSIDVEALREGLEELDARALAARLADVERAIRSLEAVAVSIVASADQREVFRDDCHVSV